MWDDSKNKLKGFSKSYRKILMFDEYTKCLEGNDYQEVCDNYIFRPLDQETCLQKVTKTSISPFDDKRC